MSEVMGSEPGDSTNTSGLMADESLKEGLMEKGMGSTKRGPISSDT